MGLFDRFKPDKKQPDVPQGIPRYLYTDTELEELDQYICEAFCLYSQADVFDPYEKTSLHGRGRLRTGRETGCEKPSAVPYGRPESYTAEGTLPERRKRILSRKSVHPGRFGNFGAVIIWKNRLNTTQTSTGKC